MIVNQQRNVRIALKPLQRFLHRVKKESGVQDFGITVCFVSDAEIAGMNERFRKKTGPTDVLSFPSGTKRLPAAKGRKRIFTQANENTEGTETQKRGDLRAADKYLGDIAIAPQTARRYAKKHGRTLSNELRVLILHGVLHLLGYDHETDHGEMNRIERRMRQRLGLS